MKGGKQSAMNVPLQPFPQCASDQLLQKIYNLVCDYLLLQKQSPKGMRTQWRSPYLHHKKQNLSQFYRKIELVILTVMKHKNPSSRSRSPELTFCKHVETNSSGGIYSACTGAETKQELPQWESGRRWWAAWPGHSGFRQPAALSVPYSSKACRG